MGYNNINIKIESSFIKERSSSSVPIYLFSYNVKIHNQQILEVQLLSRYWHMSITRGYGDG